MHDLPQLSFVIPALNEAHNIERTLASIQQQAVDYCHEVILVDNGSTDGTVQLAKQAGALVLVQPGGTIAALRNSGVHCAQGQVVIFLDADASLTEAWRRRLPAALAALQGGEPCVTGSHCAPPDTCSWIERNWFGQFALEPDVSHLGSGHMLIEREFFLKLGGFDECLETGEDYELCQRARAAGSRIVNDPELRVIHHDFPRSLRQFAQREAWHGRSDFRSARAFLQSKVAIGTAIFLISHLIMLIGMLLPDGRSIRWLGLLLLLLLLAASTWKKYRHAPWRIRLINAGLFYVYYLGRTASLLHVLSKRFQPAPV